MKIVSISGARPQFIKAAVFHREVAEHNQNNPSLPINDILVHTGQHYDANMSDIFFEELNICSPHYHLGIGGCSHGAMTGRMIEKMEEVYLKEKPDWVVVYGDTNSTLAGALTAVKLHIPVAHIEAGLRSFNRKMPEEMNRIIVDQCADLLFTPTLRATKQLLSEGIPKERICEVGDVMADSAFYFKNHLPKDETVLQRHSLESKKYVLATIHRAENTNDRNILTELMEGLILISENVPVVFPLHPRTENILKEIKLFERVKNRLNRIEPVGYLQMIHLIQHAQIVMTDSGGLQKEAYFFQTPCITLRTETEWMELVDHGFNILSKLNRDHLLENYRTMKEKSFQWDVNIFGDGMAGQKIIKEILAKT